MQNILFHRSKNEDSYPCNKKVHEYSQKTATQKYERPKYIEEFISKPIGLKIN